MSDDTEYDPTPQHESLPPIDDLPDEMVRRIAEVGHFLGQHGPVWFRPAGKYAPALFELFARGVIDHEPEGGGHWCWHAHRAERGRQ